MGAQSVQAVTVIDSTFSNTPLGIKTFRNVTSTPPSSGSLILENVAFDNVPVIVQNSGRTALAGSAGRRVIRSYAQGHRYNPQGPTVCLAAKKSQCAVSGAIQILPGASSIIE